MLVNSTENPKQVHLKKVLSPIMLWGLGVGYVISGMYFGWNLGLKEGGTLGLAIATAIIIVLYVCFSFSYAELACAIPKAGGVFDYANKAFGDQLGFIAGMAQMIEFIFYLWMVKNLYSIKNITPYRYIDWFLTTPTMLVTFLAYLDANQYINLFDFNFFIFNMFTYYWVIFFYNHFFSHCTCILFSHIEMTSVRC